MRISARFLLLSLFLLPFFFVLSSKTYAQTPSSTPNQSLNSDVPINLHTNTQVVMIETISAMVCQLTGYDFINPDQRCLGIDPKTNKIGFVEDGGGIIKSMSTLVGYTFISPASSGHYVHYLSDNFGVTKKAYAANECQGIGFCSLLPILSIWVMMRNLVYLIFVLVFVLIGLAIMLRIHIDPRTVMSVQNQIPKIIVGIVLVTFSFSIAGLLVDVMYVSTYLLSNIISQAAPHSQSVNSLIVSNNPFDALNKVYAGGGLKLATDSSTNITELVNSIFFGPSGDSLFLNRFGDVDLIGGALKGIVSVFIGILAFLIIAIAIIYVLMRLWIILLFSYLNILLDIIFAPFWFVAGLLPGSSLGISGWFKDILANLAVYPATVLMLILANVFITSFRDIGTKGGDIFVPPLLGNPSNITAITGIIGLGFFFMIPNVLTVIKAALKAPKIDLGPVFKPALIGAGAVTSLPKRTFGTVERARYANKTATGKDRLFAFFGNPLYRDNRIAVPGAEPKKVESLEASHDPGIPGGGAKDH